MACETYALQGWGSPSAVYLFYGLKILLYVGGWWLFCSFTSGMGDLGKIDADGFLYISDRRVDMFTVGGRNVYPAEIEAALSEHPDVLSCLVVGVPDDDLGQVPYALVQAGAELDQQNLQEFLRERIAGYKVPVTVEFVDAPLRDDAGKARRSAVRADITARLRLPEAG